MITSLQSFRYDTSLSLYGLFQGICYVTDLRKKRETTRETLKNYSNLTSEQMVWINTGVTFVAILLSVVEAMFALFHYFF